MDGVEYSNCIYRPTITRYCTFACYIHLLPEFKWTVNRWSVHLYEIARLTAKRKFKLWVYRREKIKFSQYRVSYSYKKPQSGHRQVWSLCREDDRLNFDVSEWLARRAELRHGSSVLWTTARSSRLICSSEECDVHLGSSSTSADISDICHHRVEAWRSWKSTISQFLQCDKLARYAACNREN